MTIYLKGVFKPLGRDRVQIDVQPTNPFQEQTINDILISIHPGEMTLTAVQKINIADEILIYFKDEHKKIPRNEEFESVKIPMYEAVENIVRYLKYFYGIYEIDDIDEKIIMENAFSWSPD
ncbi:MAG TPA: hypothetical protein VEV16_09635, partial [Daejeonella sp.]|nr:hypothetical protein [Daejeonella sp.]